MRVRLERILFLTYTCLSAGLAVYFPNYKDSTSQNGKNSTKNRTSPGFKVGIFPIPDEIPVMCRPITQTRYITQGNCTSKQIIVDQLCTGKCRPITNKYRKWLEQYKKNWTGKRPKLKEWRCVNDKMKKERITLFCKDTAQIRHIEIKTVKSCKCRLFNKKTHRNKKSKLCRRLRRRWRRQRNKRRHLRQFRRKCRHSKRKNKSSDISKL